MYGLSTPSLIKFINFFKSLRSTKKAPEGFGLIGGGGRI